MTTKGQWVTWTDFCKALGRPVNRYPWHTGAHMYLANNQGPLKTKVGRDHYLHWLPDEDREVFSATIELCYEWEVYGS